MNCLPPSYICWIPRPTAYSASDDHWVAVTKAVISTLSVVQLNWAHRKLADIPRPKRLKGLPHDGEFAKISQKNLTWKTALWICDSCFARNCSSIILSQIANRAYKARADWLNHFHSPFGRIYRWVAASDYEPNSHARFLTTVWTELKPLYDTKYAASLVSVMWP